MIGSATLEYTRSAEFDRIDTPPPSPKPEVPSSIRTDATVSEYDDVGAFARHFKKLREIARGKADHGFEPPSKLSIAWAQSILKTLKEHEFVPERVVASAEGGVAICFVVGAKYGDIECLNTGEILGVTTNRKDRPIAWEIGKSPFGLASASTRIRKFLNS